MNSRIVLHACDIASHMIIFVLSDLTQNEDVILLYLTVLQKVGDFFAFLCLCLMFVSYFLPSMVTLIVASFMSVLYDKHHVV